MTTRQKLHTKENRVRLGLTLWNAEQLSRFCEVGYELAQKQFSKTLQAKEYLDTSQRKEILDALMMEVEAVTENLIVLALATGDLDADNLHRQIPEKKRRRLILSEEE